MMFRLGVGLLAIVVLFFRYSQPGDTMNKMGVSLLLAVIFSIPFILTSHLIGMMVSSRLPTEECKTNEWRALNFRSVDPDYRRLGYFEFYSSEGAEKKRRVIPHYQASVCTHSDDSFVVEAYKVSTKKGWLTKIFGEGFARYRYNIRVPESYFSPNEV